MVDSHSSDKEQFTDKTAHITFREIFWNGERLEQEAWKERDDDDDEEEEEEEDNDEDDDEREFIPLVLSVKALYNEKNGTNKYTNRSSGKRFLILY